MFNNPLFIGCHADDIEIFCGGALSKYSKDAKVLTFSRSCPVSPIPKEEISKSMEVFGLSIDDFSSFDLKAGIDGSESFIMNRQYIFDILVEAKEVKNPDVVFTVGSDTHQEHAIVYDEVVRVFKNFCPIIESIPLFNNYPFKAPNYFVPLTVNDVTKKIQAIRCYKSQRNSSRVYLNSTFNLTLLRFWGFYTNNEYAEPYRTEKLWI